MNGVKLIRCKRGEIYKSNLGSNTGSEQSGNCFVLIVQNDIGNTYSSTTLVVPIVLHTCKKLLPVQVKLHKNTTVIEQDSVIHTEQLRVIDKVRLGALIDNLPRKIMLAVDKALYNSIGLS